MSKETLYYNFLYLNSYDKINTRKPTGFIQPEPKGFASSEPTGFTQPEPKGFDHTSPGQRPGSAGFVESQAEGLPHRLGTYAFYEADLQPARVFALNTQGVAPG